MANEELNQLIEAARKAAFFIRANDGYENSKLANELSTLADKVERQKLLAIGRLAARVVMRNSRKAVEQSVQADECPHCHAKPAYTDQQTYPDICSECGTRR